MGLLDKTRQASKVDIGSPVAGHKLDLREVGRRLERPEPELLASRDRSVKLSDCSVGWIIMVETRVDLFSRSTYMRPRCSATS
jgi:hypothetical protein